MEDVLEVSARPRDPGRPLVCLDEFCKQLLGETRVPLPTRPGTPMTYDYEYVGNGCASAFVIHFSTASEKASAMSRDRRGTPPRWRSGPQIPTKGGTKIP